MYLIFLKLQVVSLMLLSALNGSPADKINALEYSRKIVAEVIAQLEVKKPVFPKNEPKPFAFGGITNDRCKMYSSPKLLSEKEVLEYEGLGITPPNPPYLTKIVWLSSSSGRIYDKDRLLLTDVSYSPIPTANQIEVWGKYDSELEGEFDNGDSCISQ